MSELLLKNEKETENAAIALALATTAPAVIYLEGELGAGKTSFAQGFLRGLGYTGLVKSPTFTLVETYHVHGLFILHADLYRVEAIEELENIGFRDYFNQNTIALIEWASKAKKALPKPNLICTLTIPENGVGRILTVMEKQ